jgi:hypothetical protein
MMINGDNNDYAASGTPHESAVKGCDLTETLSLKLSAILGSASVTDATTSTISWAPAYRRRLIDKAIRPDITSHRTLGVEPGPGEP